LKKLAAAALGRHAIGSPERTANYRLKVTWLSNGTPASGVLWATLTISACWARQRRAYRKRRLPLRNSSASYG